jgi:hypothetical protein
MLPFMDATWPNERNQDVPAGRCDHGGWYPLISMGDELGIISLGDGIGSINGGRRSAESVTAKRGGENRH